MITVFIVEDDPMVLDVNQSFLEKVPFFQCVGSALNATDALTQIKNLEPDLVLLDMYLPDCSGLEVLAKLREERIPSDVIMITAARDAATIHEVFRLGAVDYLVKPFRFDRFQAALETYQKMWKKLNDTPSLKQEDIDQLKNTSIKQELLPKGLSTTTLRQIMLALFDQKEPVTAEQLASHLGMARVTVRRYLEYLEQESKVKVHVQYGSVGRPSHFYSM
jgi:two-component system response regulator DctR